MISTATRKLGLRIVVAASALLAHSAPLMRAQAPAAHVSPITVTSPSLTEGGHIPVEFTCAAGSSFKSPQVDWAGVPSEARSVVLYFHDLDPHPNGGTDDVLHWVVWNLSPTTKGLPAAIKNEASAIPGATQGLNTHATVGYYGPCPPPGQPDHHYVFEVFALSKTLPLAGTASRHELLDAMNGNIVGHGVLVALFSRKP